MNLKSFNQFIIVSCFSLGLSIPCAGIPSRWSDSNSEVSKSVALSSPLTLKMKKELSRIFPDSRILFKNEIQWTRGGPEDFDGELNLTLLSTDSRGNAQFSVSSPSQAITGECWITFEAWTSARIALKRIHPGETLAEESIGTREINLASAQHYDYRGLIFSDASKISRLEAVQTLMEGQLILRSAVQRIPDIRKGETVQVQLNSRGLMLSAPAIAQEPSYLSQKVRVMTLKTKKELSGKLMPNGIVEVTL